MSRVPYATRRLTAPNAGTPAEIRLSPPLTRLGPTFGAGKAMVVGFASGGSGTTLTFVFANVTSDLHDDDFETADRFNGLHFWHESRFIPITDTTESGGTVTLTCPTGLVASNPAADDPFYIMADLPATLGYLMLKNETGGTIRWTPEDTRGVVTTAGHPM